MPDSSVTVFVAGGQGMLGSDFVLECQRRGWTLCAPPRSEFDIADPMAAASVAAGAYGGLDWVVNCAAYTRVDQAETDRDEAMRANALGPGYLSRAAAAAGARFLHLSTDFVFDGTKGSAYEPDDPPRPLGVYGESKRMGEEAALGGAVQAAVLRTSWLFGPNGASFPRSILRAALAGKPLRVVDDQTGTPTYTGDLARAMADFLALGPEPGIYHAAGPDQATWRALAELSLAAWSKRTGWQAPPIEPIRTEQWPTAARRPPFSALSSAKLAAAGIAPLRPLEQAMAEFVERLPDPP